MRKILSILGALLLSTSLWATAPCLTADFTAKTAGHGAYNDTWTYGDFTMAYAANNNKNWAYMKFGGKSTTIADYNPCYVLTGKVTKAIDSINVVTNVGNLSAGSVNEWGVYVYSDAECTVQVDHVTGGAMTSKTAETLTLKPTTSWAADLYYKIYFDLANTTTTNGIVWIDKIEWYENTTPAPTTKKVYLNTGGSSLWNQGGAQFTIYTWKDAVNSATFMTLVTGETDIYEAEIPIANTNVIFIRNTNEATTPGFDDKWNQTGDLTIPDGKNCYTITGWGDSDGSWSAYTPPVPIYYVTGNDALVGAAKAWKADAIEMADGSYKFTNLPAGEYQLKVTKGDWALTSWGFAALSDASSNYIYDEDGNIAFEVETPNDVTIAFDGSKITVTGTFVERTTTFTVTVPEGTTKCYIAGNFNGWAHTAMTAAGANKFSYVFSGDPADTALYKYCAGPAWKYVELNSDGSGKDNREYAAADVVAKWTKLPGATLADTYTSNVTLSIDGGANASEGKAVVFGDEYDAIKAGTSSNAGKVVVTVPAGVKKLHFHALGWAGKEVKLQVAAGDDVLANLDLKADDGVAGTGPKYTIVDDPEENGYYSVLVNTAVETQITFTATANYRFLLFGVNTELIPIDPRAKRNIVLDAGGQLQAADPSMFVFAWGNGKAAYDTIMTINKVGDDTLYVARIPEELDSVIFVRAAHGLKDWSELVWDAADPNYNVWNQTPDLFIDCDTAVFNGWVEGTNKFDVVWCPQPIITKWYIVGGFTKWLTNKVELEATEKADSLSVKIELKADTAVNFKLIRIRTQGAVALDTTWYGLPKDGEGNVDEVHYGHSTGLLFYDDGEDVKLNPTNANDDYTFSVDVAHMVGTNLVPVVDVIIPKRVRPVDTREKRDIVLEAGEVATADPSMFVFAWGNGKTAYDTVMTIKKVGDDTLYVARIPEELDSLIFVRAAHGLEDWSEIIWSGVGANVWNQTEDLLVEADTASFEKWIEGTNKFAITWKKIKPIDTRVKREIVLDAGGQLQVDDPSMFVMAFGDGKAAYDTVMTIKKVGDDTLYVARIPEELDSLVFVRAAHGLEDWSELVWDATDPNYNVWNQTADLLIGCDTAAFEKWVEGTNKFEVSWCKEPVVPAAKQTIRLVPRIWDADGAQFAAWYWKAGEDGAWTEFLTVVNDTIDIEISQVADHIIFARFSDVATAPAWNESELKDGWNKTGDIEIAGTVFTITDWTEGTWAAYDPGEVVHYYITGNEALVGVGKDWDTEAIPVKGSDSYTFKNLAAATEYQLKLTTGGDWTTTTAYGFADLAYQVAGVTDNGEGNITFTLAEAGDVKITMNSEKKIVIEGNFVKPVTQYGLLINDADFKAAWQNPNNPVELMLTGVSLSNGDKFVLYDDDNDASWIISNFKDDSYTFNIAGEDPNKYYEVTEAGLYDFYVYSTYDGTDNYIYVAKQGSTGCENVYGTEVELRKVIENGVLYIYRDGKVYNIQGQLVR